MGNKVLAGIGRGLQEYGRAEAQRKKDEEILRLSQQELAMKERDLQIREQEAASRAEMQKLKMAQEKVLHNNKQLMQAFTESKGDPALMETAMNAYTNTGFKYQLNRAESDMEKGRYVYDVGVYKKQGDGGLKAGIDGKPEFEKLPLESGKKVFNSPEEFQAHIIQVSNPEIMLANELDKTKSQSLMDRAKQMYIDKLATDKKYRAELEKTPEGQRFIEMHKAKIDSITAETAKTKKETDLLGTKTGKTTAAQAPVANVMDAYGKNVELTGAEKEMAVSNQKSMQTAGYKGISVQEAYRVAQLKDDPAAQQAIAEELDKVLKGESTPDQFRKYAKEFRIPRKFFDDMLMDAEEAGELSAEEQAAREPGRLSTTISWLNKWVNRLTNPIGTMANEKLTQKNAGLE